MKLLFPLLFTLILAAQALFGADEPASIAIKNKSSFNLDAGTRNPFWPIGWKATGKVASGSGGTNQGEGPAGAFDGSGRAQRSCRDTTRVRILLHKSLCSGDSS